MSTSTTSSIPTDIVPILVEYKKIVKEIQGMQREIQQLRKKLQPHINKLKKDMTKYEKTILQYLDAHNDPGIKFQDVILYKEPRKSYPPKKDRMQRLNQLLNEHGIHDPSFVQAMTDILQTKKVVDPNQSTLKMKVKTSWDF